MKMSVTELKNELRKMRGDEFRRSDELTQHVGVNEHKRFVGFSISEDDQRVLIVVSSTVAFPDAMQPALDKIVAELNKGGGAELTTAVDLGVIHCLNSMDFDEFMASDDLRIISLCFVELPARVLEAITLAEAVKAGKPVADVLERRRRATSQALGNTRIEIDAAGNKDE